MLFPINYNRTTAVRAGVLAVLSILCLCFEFDSPKQVEWLDANGAILDGAKDGLAFFDPAHPGTAAVEDSSRFRIRLTGFHPRPSARLSVVSMDPQTGLERDRLDLGTLVGSESGILQSPWLVLVASGTDKNSSALFGSALVARPGDEVEARVRIGGAAADVFVLPVGRPSYELGPMSLKIIDLHVTVLRKSPNRIPIIGGDANGVQIALAHQVSILNEVLAQCFIQANLPEYFGVSIEDPPGSGLIAVGEQLGLPSSGGLVRLMVDGDRLGPWRVGKGFTPSETARLISHHLNQSGFITNVSTNKRPASYALETADILVRREDGTVAQVTPWPDLPLSTDARQSLDIGSVTLADGIDAYDENNTASGTLEERTLIKTLEDSNVDTIDIFVVNYFSPPFKQGESFIRAGESSLGNAVLLNIDALVRARHSYTLPHEIGHILLRDLGHPDDYGYARTDLLMHSSSSSAHDGPKRLTKKECAKIRNVSAYLFQ